MNHFILIHTLTNPKRANNKCLLVQISQGDEIKTLENTIKSAEISNAVQFVNPDQRPVDVPQGRRQKRHFNHFEWIDKDRFIIADQDEANIFNVRTNELSVYLNYAGLKLNGFNLAYYKTMVIVFCQDGSAHVFNDKRHIGKLDNEFSGLLPFINYANTSRGVQFKGKNLYFLDKNWDLYWFQMDKMVRLIQQGDKKFQGVLIQKKLDYFCLSQNGHDIFMADSEKTVKKYQCGQSFHLPKDERVTAMVSQYGLVVTASMTETKDKKPDKVNRYYFHDQAKLRELMPCHTKAGNTYNTNMVQSIQLHKLKYGILMIGLPNYQICDFYMLNKNKLTVLNEDKQFESLCHWTMAIDHVGSDLNVYYGTMSSIYKLEIKV